MIIVSGWLRVDAEDRATYLEGCRDVITAARNSPGCVDFHLSVDPVDDGRVNVFEQWETVGAVERFRGSGPSDGQEAMITSAHVEQHEITGTTLLT